MKISATIRNSICASALAIAAAGSASAAVVTLDSVAGQWTSVTSGSRVTGLGTNAIAWGIPNGSNTRQSGYRFDGAASQTLTEGESTALGTFSHLNYIIDVGTSITAASLNLTFGLTIDGVAQTITNSYNFTHWETHNANNPCADGGSNGGGTNVNGCSDRVQATLNDAVAETFTIDGTEYTIDITGFNIADQNGIPTFWTVENRTNSAQLFGSFTEYTPAAVPLPAAGWMLMAGLGGLAAARRRKKAK